MPAAYLGQRVKVRADRNLVRVYHRGVLIKTHPRTPPGGRVTDPADLPPEKAAYATRDGADRPFLEGLCACPGGPEKAL